MNRKSFIAKAGLLAAGAVLPIHTLFGRPAADAADLWRELVSYARWCPSPHNVQPWKLKILSSTEAQLYYDPRRIPVIVDDSTSFTIVGMGMFIECLDIAARSRGYSVVAHHESEPRLDSRATGLKLFAGLQLLPFIEKAAIDRELILKRRTSRLHYDGGVVPAHILDGLKTIAGRYGHTLSISADKTLVDSIIHLNTNTILKRSDDAPTMAEMRQWIRTTGREAAEKKDGLWSEANATSGKMMHNFFYHHQRFDHGWKLRATRNMLNKSMKGTAQMAWINGPFAGRQDWVQAGAMLQQLWLTMTEQGLYMHPLGTIVTTAPAKSAFLSMTETDESAGPLWFLVRIGYSKEPPRSFRLEEQDIVFS